MYLTHPPVSVCGTVALLYNGPFLGCWICESDSAGASSFPCGTKTFIALLEFTAAGPVLNFGGAVMLKLLSIAYAHWLLLRFRLTLGGFTLPRKPWVYGDPEIIWDCATYVCILTCSNSTGTFVPASRLLQCSPTNEVRRTGHRFKASVYC